MAITLSDTAAQRIQSTLDKKPEAIGLLLDIRKAGCTGWVYDLGYAEEVAGDATVFEDKAVQIIVTAEALQVVDGTHIDYVSEGLNQSFKFNNPNVTDECGCGESFTTET